MFKSTMLPLALSLPLLFVATGCGDAETNPTPAEPSIEGRWVSPACEAYPNGSGGSSYILRDTTLTVTDAIIHATLYKDAACSAPLWSDTISAKYVIGPMSATVAGAKEIDFNFTDRELTPLSMEGASILNGAMAGTCGDAPWVPNTKVSVSKGGCTLVGVPSITDCPAFLDLTKLEGDKLYNGDHVVGVDACKTRLTSLSPLFLVRAK